MRQTILRLTGIRLTGPAAAAAIMLCAAAAEAGVFTNGSSFTVAGTNSPGGNFAATPLTVGNAPALIAGGTLNASATIIADGPNADWILFSVTAVSGGSLAGNINAYWDLAFGFATNQAATFDKTTIWWSDNGTAVDLTANFGFGAPGPNQIDPLLGEAFNNSFGGGPVQNGFQDYTPSAFVNPYNFITAGGIDPATADGFHMAFHFTAVNPVATVPEPAALMLLGAGLIALGMVRRRNAA